MLPNLFNFCWDSHLACVYRPAFYGFGGYFKPINDFKANITLVGLEKEMLSLSHNTRAFLEDKKASHALLWGARGCGKSSLLKLTLSQFLREDSILRVIELNKESLGILPMVQDCVRDLPYKFVIVCDDLCFESNDHSYKSLKSILEGSFENKAHNVLLYTTSNYRHLVSESYPQDTLHLNDAQDEILSLSDRFGLSIGFYAFSRAEYLELIAQILNIKLDNEIQTRAMRFSTLKGSCSPRIAQEFCILYRNKIL